MTSPETSAPEQSMLIPPEPPAVVDELLPIADLPDDADLIGPAPTPQMVEDVRRFGVLVPIVVAPRHGRDGDGRRVGGPVYDVIAGRRRIKAARAVGLGVIPARLVTLDQGPISATLTVQLQQQRANPAAELEAIERMLALGATESEIARATGMAVAAIRQRLRLRSLAPTLRAAFQAGRVSPSVAEGLAKLPEATQATLAAKLEEEGGTITGTDVHDARSAGTVSAVAALDLGGFDEMPSTVVPDDLGPPVAPVPLVDRDTAAAILYAVDLLRGLLAVVDDQGADADFAREATGRARLFIEEYDRA